MTPPENEAQQDRDIDTQVDGLRAAHGLGFADQLCGSRQLPPQADEAAEASEL